MLSWVCMIAAIAGSGVFSLSVIAYYADPHQRSLSVTVAAVAGLTLSVMSLLAIPVDVYGAADPGASQSAVKTFYYTIFSSSLISTFVLLPFALFYNEASVAEHDPSAGERACTAAKYTSMCVALLVALLVVGVYVEPSKHHQGAFTHRFLSTMEDTDRCLLFAIGAVGTIGLIGWIMYTAVGLAALPVAMLLEPRQSESAEDHMDAVQVISTNLAMAKSKVTDIENSYQLSGRTPSRHDRQQVAKYREQVQIFTAELNRLKLNSKSWAYQYTLTIFPSPSNPQPQPRPHPHTVERCSPSRPSP
eukprot:TRINITY_DN12526_c0_g3_i3.p1 TRINITY_DN12526_c0_g3~~TRINITY_DN12526_c0_g3_i3.p1  ORF type:complete len:304 (-),score=58.09 TRINITY_DN12526_c0_g3_i3:19-930(-)